MATLLESIDSLPVEVQSKIHNFLENHLLALGVLEYEFTEDEKIVLNDRSERHKKGEAKGITLEEWRRMFGRKNDDISLRDTAMDTMADHFSGSILALDEQEKIELFEHLQPAADKAIQLMLDKFGLTREKWDEINEELHQRQTERYKKEADEIRARKRTGKDRDKR